MVFLRRPAVKSVRGKLPEGRNWDASGRIINVGRQCGSSPFRGAAQSLGRLS
nr:MAG TPA: hypothetical protein [Caudoviricetes sp.]